MFTVERYCVTFSVCLTTVTQVTLDSGKRQQHMEDDVFYFDFYVVLTNNRTWRDQ